MSAAVNRPLMPAWLAGEFLGTFLLVFFGCGSVATAILTGAQVGIFQVAIVWGLGIATAIYLTASLSGAHLNPAVTIGLAACARFPWRDAPKYVVAQLAGAFVASVAIYFLYRGSLIAFEHANGIVRGATGSESSAMIFGEYFPNPGGHPFTEDIRARVSHLTAFVAEIIGTAILMVVILGSTDARNGSRPKVLTAATIGLTVTLLISLFGPLTMACLNPARDLAPRLFSAMAGWGSVPFTTNGWGWFTVYIVAPILGALLGTVIYRTLLAPHYAGRVLNVDSELTTEENR